MAACENGETEGLFFLDGLLDVVELRHRKRRVLRRKCGLENFWKRSQTFNGVEPTKLVGIINAS